MQDQLLRIRNKDYSQLDQRLYSNLGMTSQLEGTIAQLSELQRYLATQIDMIQNESEKEAAMRASKVVLRGVAVDRAPVGRCVSALREVAGKLGRIGRAFGGLKDLVQRETALLMEDVREMVSAVVLDLVTANTRKNNDNARLKLHISSLEEQMHELKGLNQQLTAKLDSWQEARRRRAQRQSSRQSINIYLNTDQGTISRDPHQAQTINTARCSIQQSISNNKGNYRHFSSVTSIEQQHYNETPRLPMPLRKQSPLKDNSQALLNKYLSCKTITDRKDMGFTSKNSGIQQKPNKGMESNGTQPTSYEKQNILLRLKGADPKQNQRKSVRKLKLFSIM